MDARRWLPCNLCGGRVEHDADPLAWMCGPPSLKAGHDKILLRTPFFTRFANTIVLKRPTSVRVFVIRVTSQPGLELWHLPRSIPPE